MSLVRVICVIGAMVSYLGLSREVPAWCFEALGKFVFPFILYWALGLTWAVVFGGIESVACGQWREKP